MKPETREETSNINQNQDQIQTQGKKLISPKAHDEILLRRKTGALSDTSLLQRDTSLLQETQCIRAELLAHPYRQARTNFAAFRF